MEGLLTIQHICIATLAYYSALGDMPLTSTEVWQWQMNEHGSPTKVSLLKIRQALASLIEKNTIKSYNGFYSLSSNPSDARERRWRIAETMEKRHTMARRASFLPLIPFVRSVRILGSVATGNARANSDIDLSIGIAEGRLWFTRALVTSVAHLLGVRRWGSHTANRLCFNHYTSLSGASYGTSIPAFFHIERQSIPLWPSKKRGEHAITRFFELILEVSGVAGAMEWGLGIVERAKIRSNTVPYPAILPPPSRKSVHLIFYYPRVLAVETLWKKILSFNLVNF